MRFDNNNVQPLRLAVTEILDGTLRAIRGLENTTGVTDFSDVLGDWSVQGMGLLRLYIRKLGRLHIWDDALRYPNASMIHTHSWDLVSTIVSGGLINFRYVETVPYYDVEGRPYKKQSIFCGYNARSASPVVDTHLAPTSYEILEPGDVYRQRAAEIHKTEARNGTVTIMERHEEGEGRADVFWPADCTWGDAKPRRATPDEIRTTVTKALELLETNR